MTEKWGNPKHTFRMPEKQYQQLKELYQDLGYRSIRELMEGIVNGEVEIKRHYMPKI
jgi:hypothetical protein